MSVTCSVKNNNVDFAMKKLRRDVSADLAVARSKKEYKKPGDRRREEKKINTINSRKNQRKQNYR